MKTTITTTNTATTTRAVMTPDESMRWVEEMDYWRAAISYESLSALMDLQSDRELAKSFRGRDDFSPEDFHPSIDEALQYALKVARKTARSDLKVAHGQWAIRKLQQQARNKASAA